MKKYMFTLVAMMTIVVSASAMSYSQAREQALFLTDKMAYELNLNDEQYEAAFEINLDYLMGINTYDDLYGTYWTRRNLDLSYILLDWQYRAYCAANYFYRPLYWDGGFWHFGIYARYPHRDYFYFGRPAFVNVYRGGHSWHNNGNRSWYQGRDFNARINRDGGHTFGMRDRFDRGDFGKGTRSYSGRDNSRTSINRNSATPSFGGRSNTPSKSTNNRSFGSRATQQNDPMYNRNSSSSFSNRNSNTSFGNRNNQQSTSVSSGSFGNRTNSSLRSSTRTTVERRSNNSSYSFGNRSNSQPSRTFTPSSTQSTRSSGSSFGGRSGGSSSSSSFGGGHSGGSRTGGGSFGGGHR